MSTPNTSDHGPDVPPPRLALRPDEAAAALGIGRSKLYELMADRTAGLPVIRVGRTTLIPVRELEQWLTEQARKA